MNPLIRRVARSTGMRLQKRLHSSEGNQANENYEYQSQKPMSEEVDRSWAEKVRKENSEEDEDSLSWLSGEQAIGLLTESRYKIRTRKAENPGEKPRVDYLKMMEMAYGPREYWHQGDPMFMRRVIPVLCRKIDDLRERLGDTHRAHRKYRDVAEQELRKIPLYKREAWMSPDLTRAMLVDDLQSSGLLDENGSLKTLESIVKENAHLLPRQDVETVYITKPDDAKQLAGSKQGAEAPSDSEVTTTTTTTTTTAVEEAAVEEAAVEEAAVEEAAVEEAAVEEAAVDDIIPSAATTISTTSPSDVSPSSEIFDESEPLVIDPLLADIYAPPAFYGVPEKTPYLPPKPIYERLPGGSSIRHMAIEQDNERIDGCDKIWVKYNKDHVVEADLDTNGSVRKVDSLGNKKVYADGEPRLYNAHRQELNKDGTVMTDEDKMVRDSKNTISVGGRKTNVLQNPELVRIAAEIQSKKNVGKQQSENNKSEPEPEMYQFTPEYKPGKAPDPTMNELIRQRTRRRKHESDIWEKLEFPREKPGNVVANAVTKLASTYGKVGVPLRKKMEAVEKIALSTLPEVLLDPYCNTPTPAPDSVDKHLKNIEKMSSGAIEQIENDAREITKRMKPARIEGASFVNLLPKNEGAMKYNYQVVTDEGVWFSRSNYIGMMGKPAKTNRWPKEAVLVPTQIYKDAFLPGYEGVRARVELIELTQGEQQQNIMDDVQEETLTPVKPPKGGFNLEDFPQKD